MTAPMFKVIRGGEVFAPAEIGRPEILIAGDRILAMGEGLADRARALGEVEAIDAEGMLVVPGFIDQHIHFLGGGDFEGPSGRVPELQLSWITAGGVTTAAGLLGIDMDFKNLHGLLVKANELEHQGLTTYIYTGSFRVPGPYLTTSARADIVLIDKVIGVKAAIAEDTYPNLSLDAFAALAGEVKLAGAITGKAAVIHCHTGRNPKRLQQIFDLLEEVRLPPSQIVPTHVNRREPNALEHGIAFAKMGGTIDFSCNLCKRSGSLTTLNPDVALRQALDAGVPLAQITLSSDANVSMPVLDEDDRIIGLHNAPPTILHREFVQIARTLDLPLSDALSLVTTNVARVMKIEHRKGRLAPGKDADVVFLTPDLRVDTVIARGRVLRRGGEATVRGPYEEPWLHETATVPGRAGRRA